MKDRWIPCPARFSFIDTHLIPNDMIVVELKLMDGSWDETLIRNMFKKEDVDAILSIPTTYNQIDDVLCWHYSKDGEYTVRRGYCLAMNMGCSPCSSSTGGSDRWWTVLWRLSIPPKIKILVWRVCKGWITALTILERRKVTNEVWCPICLIVPETIMHAIWGCSWTRKVWKLAGF